MKVKNGDSTCLAEKRDEVEGEASKKPTSCFKIGRDAPIYKGQIFQDIGYLGNMKAIQEILGDTYQFPDDVLHT